MKSFEGYLSLFSLVVIERTSHTGTRRRAKCAKLIRRCYSTLIKNHKVMMMGELSEPEADPGSSRDHVLSVEDEFLLVMMKLHLGLTNLDLAMRFNVAEATISNTFITWLNLLFIQLGTLKIWPHRNVILENMPKKFKEDYPNNIIVIDCPELKIQCPSSLVIQSQSYSNYKSTNIHIH